MRMTAIHRLLSAVTILWGIACGSVRAEGPSITSDVESPAVESRCVAIMGAVAQPGTFEVEEQSLRLLELVKLAGGATPMASGNVRIIRDGRAGEQTYLSPDLKYELLPNDLVILDSWPSRSFQPNRGGQSLNPNLLESNTSSEPPASSHVQLGLINLVSHPVILNVSAQEARLGTVLSLLHQSPDDIGALTIIKPLTGTESLFCDEAVDIPLAAGSILVFDSATVDANVLPPLPALVGGPIASVSSAEPSVPRESIPQVLTRMQAEAKRAGTTESGEVDAEKASGDPAAQPVESRGLQAAPPADFEVAGEEHHAAASHTGWLVLIGAAVPGGIAFAVTRWRSKRRPRPEVPREAPPAPEGTQTLKSLISNSLPVVEEPIRLPETTIFGRPRLDSPHRFDTAHAIHGPHYAVEPATPAPQPRRASNAPGSLRADERRQELDDLEAECPPDPPRRQRTVPPPAAQQDASSQADDAPVRRIRVDRAHLPSTLGTLDRALAIFEERRP